MKIRFIYILLFALLFAACNDMRDFENPAELPDTGNDWGRIYVLCEGLFNKNNSTLACIDYDAHTLYRNFFGETAGNKRGLGDTANDLQRYNNELWIVVCTSSQVEVIDISTGKSIKQIPFFSNENGQKIARQPRYITFHGGKAYVCSFDGTVSRINTQTYEVEATTRCGRNPDGIAVANNKLYVSNSGGLDIQSPSGLTYDNTISVVDLNTFKEIKKIEVGINPHKIAADSQGDVYVVSRGNHANIKAKFHRLDSKTDELVETFDKLDVVNFVIQNDIAYMYNFDITNNSYWIKTFDCKTEEILSEHFIADATDLIRPYAIYAHPLSNDVFISDVKDYTTQGDIFCFSGEGKLRYKIEEIGLNPNTFLFYPN